MVAPPRTKMRYRSPWGGPGRVRMAQLLVSWLICGGRFRVHAINAIGRRMGRIVEVEETDTGERYHGSTKRLERLVDTLSRSYGESDRAQPWIRQTPS